MSALLEMREKLRNIYSKGEVYLTPLFKFILALVVLLSINANIGYMDRIAGNIIIPLIVALMCSFLPTNFIVLFGALFICLNSYAISLECGIITLAVFLLMFILYFRFSSKDTVLVVLLPIFFMLKIPYVIPIVAGLLGTPLSIVSVGCGTIVYYVVLFMKENAQTISDLETGDAIAKFRFVIDGLMGNKEMVIVLIAFSVIVITVFCIRMLSIDYSWTIAICVGAVIGATILLIGDLGYDTDISLLSLVLGMIASLLLAMAVQFFVFNVDYSRTEFVQFEDDEYYYYVKAVPKNSVHQTKVKVKKIH